MHILMMAFVTITTTFVAVTGMEGIAVAQTQIDQNNIITVKDVAA